jgi:hypothetical protein
VRCGWEESIPWVSNDSEAGLYEEAGATLISDESGAVWLPDRTVSLTPSSYNITDRVDNPVAPSGSGGLGAAICSVPFPS